MLVYVVNRADIRMIERRCGAGFTLQPFEGLAVTGKFVGQEFERHQTPQFNVLGFVDDTHAASSEFLEDAVVRDGLVNHGWRQLLAAILGGLGRAAKLGCRLNATSDSNVHRAKFDWAGQAVQPNRFGRRRKPCGGEYAVVSSVRLDFS